jgi:hypothetical protein
MKFSKKIVWNAVTLMDNRIRILHDLLGVELEDAYNYAHYKWSDMPNYIKRATWGINFSNPPYQCLT